MTITKSILLGVAFVVAATAAQAGPWQHYTDAKGGWSISYPQGWKADPHYVFQALGPGKDIKGVSFAIPDSVQPGTNLSHDGTTISIESLPGKNCQPSQFVDPAENVRTLKADKRTYLAADSGDAGAGNFYETQIFVVKGSCLAVRYLIHFTNIGAYDPGTVKEFDEKRLVKMFDAIRASLVLKP